jgi:hypothetical protein
LRHGNWLEKVETWLAEFHVKYGLNLTDPIHLTSFTVDLHTKPNVTKIHSIILEVKHADRSADTTSPLCNNFIHLCKEDTTNQIHTQNTTVILRILSHPSALSHVHMSYFIYYINVYCMGIADLNSCTTRLPAGLSLLRYWFSSMIVQHMAS